MSSKEIGVNGLFYILITTFTTYLLNLIYIKFSVNPDISILLLFLVIQLISLYLIRILLFRSKKILNHRNAKNLYGSLRHLLKLMLPAYIIQLVFILYFGLDTIFMDMKPPFISDWSPYTLAFSLLFWSLNSMIVSIYYHSIAYETFYIESRAAGLFASITLFSVNYNLPFLTGNFNPWDIIFYGVIFAYSYSVNRNPYALSIVYLISEAPLWWNILYPFGSHAFLIYVLAKVSVSFTSYF